MLKIRFEHVPQGKMSAEFGPFEFVQLTYESLRLSPNGAFFAEYDVNENHWTITNADNAVSVTAHDVAQTWTDVVIFGV